MRSRLGALPAVAARIASIYFGARILHHEIYEVESAELLVIAFGMWLLGVPPALWLDTLRRASRSLEGFDDRPGGKDPDE